MSDVERARAALGIDYAVETRADHDPGCYGSDRYCSGHCPVPVQGEVGPGELAERLAPLLAEVRAEALAEGERRGGVKAQAETFIAALRARLSHVEAERDAALQQLSRTLVKQRVSLSDPPEVGWWWTPLGREGHDSQVQADAFDEGVEAAFRGAVTRQNADDVKQRNPYRAAALASGRGAVGEEASDAVL